MTKEILIYQPSKVGSTTVFTHLMNHYGLTRDEVITTPVDNNRYPINKERRIYHTHHETTLPNGLKNKLSNNNELMYFISMTRDPVSRNISSFFLHEKCYCAYNSQYNQDSTSREPCVSFRGVLVVSNSHCKRVERSKFRCWIHKTFACESVCP